MSDPLPSSAPSSASTSKDANAAPEDLTVPQLRARAQALEAELIALRARERQLREVLKAGRLGWWELDLRSGAFQTSSICKANFGRPADTPFTYDDLAGAVHPDDGERWRSTVKDAVSQVGAFHIEYRNLWPDGSIHWISVRGDCHAGEDGGTAKLSGVSIDVTDRRLAEQVAQRFQTVLENSTEFVGMCDLEGRPFFINTAALRMVGLPDLAAIQRVAVKDFFFPEDQAFVMEQFLPRVLRDGSGSVEIRFRHFTTGEPIWMHYSVVALIEEGRPTGFATISQNIHARRRTEHQLRESEDRNRTIVESLPQLVWTCTPDGACDYLSPQWERYTGRPAAEQLGAGWLAQVHPDDRAALVEAWTRSVQTGERFHVEFRIRDAAGEFQWFATEALPLRNARGEVVKWFGTNMNIDDRRRAEAQLREARDATEQAGRAKDDFLAALSHELRTPLNPVLLIASDAARNSEFPEEARAQFAEIGRHVELEARLIDDLLDLTRIARGKLPLERTPTDLNAIVHDALGAVRAEALANRTTLAIELTPVALPLHADGVRLQQVLWNVLKNALKFTPAGGTVSVRTQVAAGGRSAEIRISDTGIGMTAGELRRAFDPFAQGDHASGSGSRQFGGLGLGLAIARNLVVQHGGTIGAHSEGPGRGSTFTIQLPLHETASPSPAGESTTAATPAPPAPDMPAGSGQRGRRILLVEDHDATRAALARLLERRKFHVTTAGNVTEALAAAAQSSFDVLISDIGLPDGSGLDLMSDLRARSPLLGIALTGFGMETDVARANAAGFQIHLTKPVAVQALDEALRRIFA